MASLPGCATSCSRAYRRRLPARPELYAEKFRHALKTDLTPDQLEDRAASDYDEVRAQMLRLARELWPTWMGAQPMPATTTGRFAASWMPSPPTIHGRTSLLDWCRAENERIEAFIAERDLIGLADEPLQIVWTPQFLRAFGGAMLIPPVPWIAGWTASSPSRPSPTTGTTSGASRGCARTTRASCGC